MSSTEPTNENVETTEVTVEESVTIDAPTTDETTTEATPGEEPTSLNEGDTDGADSVASDAASTPAEPASEEPVTEEPATEEPVAEHTESDSDADAGAAVAPAVPTPSAVPTPAPMPRPIPRPSAKPAAPSAPAEEWGKVTDDGEVSVREGDSWRVVGQYPDGTPAEALAYFQRKFDELEFKVRNLEQRGRGGASAADLTQQATHVAGEIEGAAAVGDLAGLLKRVSALTENLSAQSEEEAQAQREAVDAAIAERTVVVEKAEALAARDPKSIQWKQASADLSALFDEWQRQQQTGPRLPKSVANDLWKRFRNARGTVERHRREFFAALDETHKGARVAKTKLVERAEALASRGEEGIPAYRSLLDEWKASGRAGRKVDDALWARFKAAGDALYGARSERDAAEQEESLPRIEERQALLAEAGAVADEADLRKARQLLTGIQRRWDEVGRIFPRDKERQLDDEMRKVEQALRSREDVDWKKNNPETQARADGMSRQLLEAIEKLESELAAAEKAGNAKAVKQAQEALDARRAWLKALGA